MAMTPEEVTRYAKAIGVMKQRTDNRSFNYWAGLHGQPQWKCQHSNWLFAFWHRAYMYNFEMQLMDIDPQVTLPYWDWTTTRNVPDPFTNEEELSTNEFYGQTLERDPGTSPGGTLPTRQTLLRGLQIDDFKRFYGGKIDPTTEQGSSGYLEANLHNSIHVWVGGHMGIVSWAAYDPLFWSHHCFIDKIFSDWQDKHPNATYPPDLLTTTLDPFTLTPKDLLAISSLGYLYGDTSRVTAATAGHLMVDNHLSVNLALPATSPLRLSSGVAPSAQAPPQEDTTRSIDPPAPAPPTTARQAIVQATHDRTHAQKWWKKVKSQRPTLKVKLSGLKVPERSVVVRVFLQRPDANKDTPTSDPHLAAQLVLLGHQCAGDPGHCDPRPRHGRFDLRPPAHSDLRSELIDVTEKLHELIHDEVISDLSNVHVKIVVVDAKTGDDIILQVKKVLVHLSDD
jgi:tyrosinase